MSESRNFGPTPLAIVGIGCLFPKAGDKLAFWSNIREGVDAIDEVPPTHWKPDEYFDSDPKAPDHVYARRGGFLDPVDFDPLSFGISPNNLDATDSSQLLGLVVADAALRDAGYGPDRNFDRSKVSVVLGVTGTLELVIPLGARLGHPLWRKALREAGVADDVADEVVSRIADGYVGWQENSFPGLLGNVVAGRIANRLNLGGTNCVVDAACASSLSAVHLAGLELAAGRADMVLTGGVDTFNDIFMYMCFSKTPALSPTGDARPFSADGDGTILGEGIGMVVLKRLADAERDNDRIYAVIRSVGSSSDGKGNAIYAPSSDGQARALRTAYRLAEVTPDTIELVEAHGTGTKVGDATEANALVEVYRADKPAGSALSEPWCAIGSVKSQIGHTKAAAGVAGVIKAALALYEKVLPPTIKVSTPVEPLAPGKSPFYVNTVKRPWIASDRHPRRAVVSAFGFGGSNFHCVLEEFAAEKAGVEWSGEVQILALSADSIGELEKSLAAWPIDLDWTEQEVRLADARRRFDVRHLYRLLIVVDRHRSDLAKLIQTATTMLRGHNGERQWSAPEGIYFGSGTIPGKLAVLFPGQGAQYVGMFRDLACQFPQMQRVLRDADRVFLEGESSAIRLSELIYPPPSFADKERALREESLRATEVTQPAIGAVSLGALAILEDFGVVPEMVAGHSYGELTALCAAGRYDLNALLTLSRLRGRLMAGAGVGEDRGAMLAVQAPLETLAEVAREEGIQLVIANKNSPSQAVLSGRTTEVRRAEEIFEKRRIRSVRLPVAAAFHSELVSAASVPFRAALDQIDLAPGKIPVIANSTAAEYPDNPGQAREILANQLARPVEFVDQINNLHQSGVRTFLEVGPGGRLTGLVKAILEGRDFVACAVDASEGKRNGVLDLARALAQLAALGYPLRLGEWDPRAGRHDALEKRVGAHTVPICGANYVKPKSRREPSKAAAARPKDATTPIACGSTPAAINPAPKEPSTKPILKQSVPLPLTGSGPLKNSDGPMPMPLQAGVLADAFRLTQQNLSAIQALQTQTADVHRRFLEGQEAAQRNLFELVQTHRQLIQNTLSGGGTAASTLPTPTIPMPNSAPMTAPATIPATNLAEPAIMSAATEKDPRPFVEKREQTVEPAVSPNPRNASIELLRAILGVIAEKTGYPSEMLQLDMELDGDLGIDSIKRVEIFSSFQEKFPDAPVVQSDQLGTLRTIRDVVDFLGAPSSEDSCISVNGASRVSSAGIGAVLSIIAEKTGYPSEMLQLDMELDGDLGIDSIKRVEIFSSFQEKFPDAPVVQSDQLGTLRTIRDVVAFLDLAALPPMSTVAQRNEAFSASDILALVAEKTGYPAEMLRLDMELDGDLGIDSIKRVEIFSAFQEKFPEAPVVQSDQLGTLRTLGNVVDFLGAGIGDPSPTSPPVTLNLPPGEHPSTNPLPARETTSNNPLPPGEGRVRVFDPSATAAPMLTSENPVRSVARYVVRPVPLADRTRQERSELATDAEIWITDDGSALASTLARSFSRWGVKTKVVSADAAGEFPIPERLGGLVILAPAGGTEPEFLSRAFTWTRAVARSLRATGNAAFVTVSRLNGVFGFGGDGIHDAHSGGLSGLAKTAGLEWPEVRCKAIDLSSGLNVEEAAERILQEFVLTGPREVGLARDGDFGLDLVLEPISPTEMADVPRLKTGDVLVVTGGARGVTAEVAVTLAERYRPTLVLFGRSPLPAAEPDWLAGLAESEIKRTLLDRAGGKSSPKEIQRQHDRILADREIRGNLARMKQAGAIVHYRSVDVRDGNAVAMEVKRIRSELGPIRGVVHGAGVLADRRIEDKTVEQFRSVHATKVTGIEAILAAIGADELKVLVLFSSSTGRLGRIGQADYAVANEVLNKIAQREARLKPGCRVLGVNWGPWEGGMVNASLAKVFHAEGIALIPLAAGANYLIQELESRATSPVEVVILGAPLDGLASKPEIANQGRANGSAARHSASQSSMPPRPSRHGEAAHASGFSLAFERSLEVATHPFLMSHVLDGHAVLPMAVMVEWLAHGALHGNPGLAFQGFDDLRVLKGVVLRGSRPVPIRIHAAKAKREGNSFVVPVELRGISDAGREVNHASAKILLASQLDAAERRIHQIDVEPLNATVAEIYREMLFHGSDLQGIKSVHGCGERGIIAESATSPSPSSWIQQPLRNRWLADPLALDASFQLMIVWTVCMRGAGSLPCHARRYRQFARSFPRDGVRILIEVTQSSQHRAIANIEFADKRGALVARMDDYECVIDDSLARAFRHQRLGERAGSKGE